MKKKVIWVTKKNKLNEIYQQIDMKFSFANLIEIIYIIAFYIIFHFHSVQSKWKELRKNRMNMFKQPEKAFSRKEKNFKLLMALTS